MIFLHFILLLEDHANENILHEETSIPNIISQIETKVARKLQGLPKLCETKVGGSVYVISLGI